MALPVPRKSAMKKAMKKAMKAKRVSKIARGRQAKAMVFRGSKEKTPGGLKSESLMRNKRGKIVSKRASAAGRRAYQHIACWTDAVMVARGALHLTGFVAINGKSLSGKALYVKAKAICAAATSKADDSAPSGTPSKVHAQAASAGA